MPLDALSALTQQSGPTLSPGGMGSSPLAGAVGGGAPPPGAPPGGDPSGGAGGNPLLASILAKTLGEQRKIRQTHFAAKQVGNQKRLTAILIAHLDQSNPEAARHLVSAYKAFDSAMKALDKEQGDQDSGSDSGATVGPALGFSGAKMADTAGPGGSQPSPIP